MQHDPDTERRMVEFDAKRGVTAMLAQAYKLVLSWPEALAPQDSQDGVEAPAGAVPNTDAPD